jgi:signal transduction histidine kinase
VPKELENEGSDLNSLISSYNVIHIETDRITKAGQRLSVIIYGVPVRFEDKTIGIFGLYADITERKKVEEELKIRNSELDNFVYKVSHDLRAPLSSILGLVNLAKLPNNTDDLDQYIDIVGKKAEQLDHFIGDVLSHSKNLKMEIKVSKIDFTKLIHDSFTELAYLAGAENVDKKIGLTGKDFYSDVWRIKEIFRNLISNAIRYRNKTLNSVSIRIKIEVDSMGARIVFSDNGVGIDEDKVGNIFEMFYRASEVSEGSGLGLYIVKNAVERLKGSIEVESKRNYGTTFTIILPNEEIART